MRTADEMDSRASAEPGRLNAADYRALIDQVPVGFREEDWSGVRSVVESLGADGVRDFRAYFGDNRDSLRELAGLVRMWDCNAATVGMFRAPTKKAFRDRMGQLLVHDGCRAFLETLCGFAQGEHRVVLRGPAKTCDGGDIYLHDTVFIPDGHRDDWRRVVHTTQDFSEQHEAELALLENEDRLRQLLETVKAIPWEADATTWRHTYVGPQAVEILGYPQEAWYQENFWLDHVHPGDRMLASEFVRMHTSGQRNYEFDYRMLDCRGNTKWLHDIVTVVSDKERPRLLRGFMLDITARKTVDVELERQRSLFEAIFESAPDGLVVENANRESVPCNPSFRRIFGYSTEELVGKTPRMLYATEQEYLRQGRLRFNPGAETRLTPYITRYRRKSGETFPGEVVGAPIKDAQGTTLGFVGLIRDITERVRSEEALEFRRKFQNIVVDISKRFINLESPAIDSGINEALAAIGAFAGADRGFVCLFQPNIEMVTNTHEWCRQGVESSLSRWCEVPYDAMPMVTERQRRGEPVRMARVSLLPETERKLLEAEGIQSFITVPLRGRGEILGFLGLDSLREEKAWSDDMLSLLSIVAEIVVNALDRKRQDEALRESEARLQAIMDNSPALMFLKDREGRFLIINRKFEEVLQTRNEEVRGKTVHELLPEEEANRIAADDREVVQLRRLLERECVMSAPDGEHTYVSVKFPVLDSAGKVIAIGGIDYEITERKRIEQQLRQAQKMEAVGQLTGGVAHDFNNLLTVLLGNLQMLQIGLEGNGELRELIDTTVEAATRSAQLTRRLLTFSRLQFPKPQLVDTAKVIHGMATLLHQTLGATIALELRVDDGVWGTYTDPSELESAILNLAINGRDAMLDGGRLGIKAANVRARGPGNGDSGGVLGEYVAITVTDTGKGISSENLHRALEPFYSTKEPGKNSGLGLSMVYGFVKRSNGHMDMDSHPGRGTKVTLYLPRAEEPGTAARTAPHRLMPTPTGSETILVVEDQPLVRRTLSKMLKILGYQILHAGAGPAALELLDTCPDIHLLLTDIVMPGGMSGVDLAREVRLRRPGVKILYTSGYANSLDLTADGASLLQKPYEFEELAAKIRAVLDT
jgi:PAS domain S-box-containing protein